MTQRCHDRRRIAHIGLAFFDGRIAVGVRNFGGFAESSGDISVHETQHRNGSQCNGNDISRY